MLPELIASDGSVLLGWTRVTNPAWSTWTCADAQAIASDPGVVDAVRQVVDLWQAKAEQLPSDTARETLTPRSRLGSFAVDRAACAQSFVSIADRA